MARLRYNGLSNSLGASLSDSATSVTFASKLTYAGGDVPTISGTDYIPLSILDANGLCAEVVHLTSYTSASTSGTISRGKEDTFGVAHDSGRVVVHGPTVRDTYTLIGSTTLGSDATTLDVTDIDGSHDALIAVGEVLSNRTGYDTEDLLIFFGGSTFDTSNSNYMRRIDYLTLGTFTGDDSSAGSCATTNGGNTQRSPFRLTMNGYAIPQYRIAIVDGRISLGTLIWENASDAVQRIRIDPVHGTHLIAGSFLKVYGITYGN
jgi:hypothetical protein